MKTNISVTSDNKVLVNIEGSIYVEDAGALRETLLKHIANGKSVFIIDFAKVDYIDSSGLGVLVSIQKRALQHSGGVIVKNLQGVVKELFELTRLTRVFEIQ